MEENQVWLLLSGPSGVGKSTLIDQMVGFFKPALEAVVTTTTRALREGEREGAPYYFLSAEEFEKRKEQGAFVETTQRHGIGYGTLKEEIESRLLSGRDLIMQVDFFGMKEFKKLRERWGKIRIASIFLKPQSLDALRERLQRRGRNSPEEVAARLKIAEEDLSHAGAYDYCFESGTYEQDFQRMRGIYLAEKARVM